MSHDWRNILVLPSATVKEVLKVIDSESLQLALVVDSDKRLLGTVTDGDIRRAFINGASLSDSIDGIMSTTPTVADLRMPKTKISELMTAKELGSIPILSDGVVVGLETIYRVAQKDKLNNPVFLMAGGFGSRLRPLTDNCPKPLLKVGDKPILERVLLSFIKCGFHDFYISTHYLPEMVQEYFGDGSHWGVSISYVYEERPLGTGGALGLLPKDLPDLPVVMMNGDILTKIDVTALLEYHNENNANATMGVREYEYQVPYGVIESEEGRITGIVEKPTHRFHVNAGIYVVGREIIDSVKENEVLDMPTLLERFLNERVLKYAFYDYWLDVGRMDDLKRAQVDIHHIEFDDE